MTSLHQLECRASTGVQATGTPVKRCLTTLTCLHWFKGQIITATLVEKCPTSFRTLNILTRHFSGLTGSTS